MRRQVEEWVVYCPLLHKHNTTWDTTTVVQHVWWDINIRCIRSTYLSSGRGDGFMKRFLNLYFLNLEKSVVTDSLWGVSIIMHGEMPPVIVGGQQLCNINMVCLKPWFYLDRNVGYSNNVCNVCQFFWTSESIWGTKERDRLNAKVFCSRETENIQKILTDPRNSAGGDLSLVHEPTCNISIAWALQLQHLTKRYLLLLENKTVSCWSYLLIYSEGKKKKRGWRFYCFSVEIQQLVIFQFSTPRRSHPSQLQS